MNKNDVLNALGKILSENLGNRMTVELANGIIGTFAQKIPDADIEIPEGVLDVTGPGA